MVVYTINVVILHLINYHILPCGVLKIFMQRYWYYLIKILKTGEVAFKLSLAIIIGGALGNLIDRVRLNYVTDFLDFTLINYPIFNLADVFVVSGVVMLSYMLLFKGDMPKISKMWNGFLKTLRKKVYTLVETVVLKSASSEASKC